jgi:hypothetical protein
MSNERVGAAAPRRLRVLAAAISAAWLLMSMSALAQDDVPQGRIIPEEEEMRSDMARARLRLGPVRLIPSVLITNAGYDSNVFGSAENPESDWTATFTAGFRFIMPLGSKMFLRADALPTYTWYDKLSDRRFFGGLYSGQWFGFFNRLSVRLGATNDQTYRNFSSEFDSRVVYKTSTGNGSFELNLTGPFYLLGEGGYTRIRNDPQGTNPPDVQPGDVNNVQRNNRDESSYLVGFRYRRSQTFSTSLAYSETRSVYQLQPLFRDNTSRAALIGILYSRPTLFINLTGGYREGVANGSTFPSYSTGTGGYFVSWFPRYWLEIRTYGRRRIVTSIANVASPYFFENRIGGGMAFELFSKLLLRGFGEFGPNNYPRSEPGDNGDLIKRRDEAKTYGGGLSLRLVRNVVISGTVTHAVYDSNISVHDRHYTRFTAFLTFNGEYVR